MEKIFLTLMPIIIILMIIGTIDIITSHNKKKDIDNPKQKNILTNVCNKENNSYRESNFILVNSKEHEKVSDIFTSDLQYNFILVTSKGHEKVSAIFISDLLGAQSKGGRYAEYLGKEIDIYIQNEIGWVWVDKIYPSERAIMEASSQKGKSKATQHERIEFIQGARVCPVCSAELELISFENEAVLEICPNGHDIHRSVS